MTSIAICDDHRIVREGLRQIISVFEEFTVLDQDIASGETLIRTLKDQQPDIILLDVSLPGRSGLEVLKQVKALYPQIKVLVLSMYPEDQFAIRMLKAGASGYLHKDSAPDVLLTALTNIANGGEYLSEKITQLLYKAMNHERDAYPHLSLSDREYEVLLFIGEGKSISEIAAQLSLSVKTISTYRSRILDKMNLDSNSDLVKYLMLHDLTVSV